MTPISCVVLTLIAQSRNLFESNKTHGWTLSPSQWIIFMRICMVSKSSSVSRATWTPSLFVVLSILLYSRSWQSLTSIALNTGDAWQMVCRQTDNPKNFLSLSRSIWRSPSGSTTFTFETSPRISSRLTANAVFCWSGCRQGRGNLDILDVLARPRQLRASLSFQCGNDRTKAPSAMIAWEWCRSVNWRRTSD